MLAILNPVNLQMSLNFKDITRQRAEFEKSLPIDLQVPKSQTGNSVK